MGRIAIRTGFCRCGCGGVTKPAAKTNTERGWVKGRPMAYLRGHRAELKATNEATRKGLIRCYNCRRDLPPDDFGKSATRSVGRQSACKRCQAKYASEWRQRNPERHRRNNESSVIRALYGITRDEYYRILKLQGGKCAICRGPERALHHKTGKPLRLAVDHDHMSGKIRGLLCANCNRGVGLFGDDPGRLSAAAEYLKRMNNG